MRILSAFFLIGIALLFFGTTHLSTDLKPGTNHNSSTGSALYDSLRATLSGYRWPTEEFLRITSSFADFRSTHFHGGIDISTLRRQGYRVFASKAGYVVHISIEPNGYGKLLLVQHPDGYKTAYAHLSRFSDSLQAYVEMLQHRNDKYPLEVNLEPNQFPVEQGDVIAYTGDTGIGVAHLHFEIHDEQFNPVNPLLVPEFSKYIKDSTPPEIRRIAFTPLDPASVVNDRQKALVMNASRVGNRDYRFRNVVRCTGDIGVELYAMDHSDDTWYRSTATDLELYVDSTLVVSSRITRVLLGETKQIALHFDWGMYKAHRWYFQRLYVEPGDDQPFYSGDSSDRGGLRTDHFSEGYHTLRILVSDVFGNNSEISGTVLFNRPPGFEIVRDSQQTILRMDDSSSLKSIVVSRLAGKGWIAKTYPASRLAINEREYSVPIPLQHASVIRIEAENMFGTKSAPRYFFGDTAKPGNVTLRMKKEPGPDYVLLTVWSSRLLSSPPILEAISSAGTTDVPLRQTDLYRYDGIYVPLPKDHGVIQLSARMDGVDDHPGVLDKFSVYPVTPADGGIVGDSASGFRLQFGEHGVYKPVNFRLERTAEGYSVSPSDVLLDKGAQVQFLLPQVYAGKVGLFNGKELLDWTDRNEKSMLIGKADNFAGSYSLLEDNDPPEISRVSVSYSRGKVRVSFRLRDQCAGVDPDAIKIRIDDDVMIGEFDPYAHSVRSEEFHQLSRGTHVVTIESSDRMANKIVVRRNLVVSH